MSSEKQSRKERRQRPRQQHGPTINEGLDTEIQPPFQARGFTRGVKPRHQEHPKLHDQASSKTTATTTNTTNTTTTSGTTTNATATDGTTGSRNTTITLPSNKGRHGRTTKRKDYYSRSPPQNDNRVETDDLNDDSRYDDDILDEVQPGAQSIPGVQPLPARDDALYMNYPRYVANPLYEETHAPREANEHDNDAPTIFTAVLVHHSDDEEPEEKQNHALLVRASPWTGYWTKQRIFVAIFALLVVAGVTTGIVISVAGRGNSADITATGSKNGVFVSPTVSPTWSPTVAPTLYPREWVQIGDLEPFFSADEFGASVGMSKFGTKVVVGATGWIECEGHGRFDVFSYNENGYWINLGSVAGNLADEVGHSTAISEDGTVVAVGAPFRVIEDDEYPCHNVTPHAGIVRVYKAETNTTTGGFNYVQRGSDLLGNQALDRFGWTVALSADGTVLATGDLEGTCNVTVFQYQLSRNDWVPMGRQGEICQDVDAVVTAISLSNDGFTLAIGAPGAGLSGQVRVYKYSAASSSWLQLGQTLLPGSQYAEFGTSVSLSDNGRTLAVGTPGYGDFIPETCIPSEVGIATIYRYTNSSSNMWERLGQELLGTSVLDRFGSGIALAGNGDIVAVGATGSNDNGEDSGSVRIFRYESSTSTWILVGGGAIGGPIAQAKAGHTLAVSQDGSRVVIGVAPEITFNKLGFVQMFEMGIFQTGGIFQLSVGGHGWRHWSLERIDVDSQERTFVTANVERGMVGSDDVFQVHSGGLYKFFFQSFQESDWYYDDYSFMENMTYLVWKGKNFKGELLAAGSTGPAPLTAVFLIADSKQRTRHVSRHGFQKPLHGPPHLAPNAPPQLDPYAPPQALQEGAPKTLGTPCTTSDSPEQSQDGKVAILQLITGYNPEATSWDLESGGNVVAQNTTMYTLPFTLYFEEICIPNSAEELDFTIYYNSWCAADGCCEVDEFGHFLLVVDIEENYIYGTVGNCNNIVPIDRFTGTLSPSTSPTGYPTDSPTGSLDLRYQIHVEIHFGARPEEVEWVLKALDLIHDERSNRTTPVERIIAYGAQYTSKSADEVVLETVDITWVVKDASPDLKLRFYFIDELSEDEEYSTVRLLSTVGTSEDTTEVSDGLLLFSLDDAPNGRKRKTIANISFFDSISRKHSTT